jgi:glutamyl-tRNA synthetase
MGKVVTRFPPEPSGFLHIGHVKAVLLNDFYARAYQGKLIIRFDDTNPSKEKEEYEQNIIKDLASLGVVGDIVTHTSDYFDVIEGHARRMINEGKAYMDDTPREQMQAERLAMQDSKHRGSTAAETMARFDRMLQGGEEGGKWCLRIKMNMQDPNGTCRDPVIYRANETPHHRTGTKYKAYPTYDFACPIVDSMEGVTHALRSSEYHDRDKQFYWMLELLGMRKVLIQDFARLNFIYTLLSKRKLNWFVENKIVDGWYDPRFPTVQGMLRRGVTVPALKEFILSQGASKRIIDMEWDKFWATNKKHVDPVAPRYTALVKDSLVPVALSNFAPANGAAFETKSNPLHPKNAEVGTKALYFTPRLFLEKEDVALMKDGEEITLMKWGNAIIKKIAKDASGAITGVEAELHLEGDVKKTEKKVTWIPDLSGETVTVTMTDFDYLITVPKLDEGDDFQAAINPITKLETTLVGEPALRLMQAGDIIQLERKGFFRCDRAFIDNDRPAVLFAIPDGKQKGLVGLADKIKAAAK